MSKGDFIGFVVVLLVGAFLFFLFTPNASEIRKLQETIRQRKEYLSAVEEQTRVTRHTIEQLKHDDPAAIEAIARDKYGFTREGEEIYQVEKAVPGVDGSAEANRE